MHGSTILGLVKTLKGRGMEESRSIRDQIRQVVDPEGHHQMIADLVSGTGQSTAWLNILSQSIGQDREKLSQMGSEYRRLLKSMEDALELLVPRGWAPLRMDSQVVDQAIDLIRNGKEDEADNLLADQWEGDGAWRTNSVHAKVSVLGAGERQDQYHQIFRDRARLVLKAKEHHEAGNYEASIPLIHAQMEGIVMDVAGGKKFYTKSRAKADLVDPKQLVSIEACLAALQALYGEGVPGTQSAGSLSRHGVAHGRELAYDTRVNSAKNWSVLDALVTWARPMAAAEAMRLREETEKANAGIDGTNEAGRRIDDREFRQTKKMLRKLQTSAAGWHIKTEEFPSDLVGRIYTTKDFIELGLPSDHGIHMKISPDGRYIWFWRETISGWVLGAAIGVQDRGFGEWHYAGPKYPTSSPEESPELWGSVFSAPPDWT